MTARFAFRHCCTLVLVLAGTRVEGQEVRTPRPRLTPRVDSFALRERRDARLRDWERAMEDSRRHLESRLDAHVESLGELHMEPLAELHVAPLMDPLTAPAMEERLLAIETRTEERRMAVESRTEDRRMALESRRDGMLAWGGAPGWPDDPADSLYRQARELLNRGEWRRAAAIFRDIPQKHPNSAYAADALYWQAFALYRIGGSAELRDALAVLEAQRGRYPGARTQSDAAALATRVRGALAARGDAAAAAQISRTASDSTTRCDQEELAVRVEALSSLTQADPDGAAPILQRVLARRDECSVQLRRNAVFLLASKRRDGAAVTQLTQVARTDPSAEVRGAAIEWMARFPGEEVVGTLEELARSSDEGVQRAAVRGLVANPTPRARAAVRTLVERSETPDRLRAEALASFSKERATGDDVEWLRGVYAKSESPRMKARIVSAVARIGGSDVDQWLLSLARNADEDSEVRGIALRRVARTLGIADMGKLYDQSADRSTREMLIASLSERPEPEATDKLIEIVKSGTDPRLRRSAIAALTRKKDPRTTRLLMEIVDR